MTEREERPGGVFDHETAADQGVPEDAERRLVEPEPPPSAVEEPFVARQQPEPVVGEPEPEAAAERRSTEPG